jgi:hypothetical protein
LWETQALCGGLGMRRETRLEAVELPGDPRLLLRNRVKRLKMLVAVAVVNGKVDYWPMLLIIGELILCPDLGNSVDQEVRSGRQVWIGAGCTGLSRFSTEGFTQDARRPVGCVGSLGNWF